MKKLNDIYEIAEDHQIIVYSYDMAKSQSLSFTRKGSCFVSIDPMQLNASSEEKVCLAHELGHCCTGSFYNKENVLDVRSRHEYRANKWAVMQLVPWEELHQALERGIIATWELAEYFEVTEDFIHTAIKVYSRQGKLCI